MALWLLPRHKQLADKSTSETCCVKCPRVALCFQELYKMCVTGFWKMTASITAGNCAVPWSQNNLINGSVDLPLKRWSKEKKKKHRLHFKPVSWEVPSRAGDTFNKQTIKWWGKVSAFVLRLIPTPCRLHVPAHPLGLRHRVLEKGI